MATTSKTTSKAAGTAVNTTKKPDELKQGSTDGQNAPDAAAIAAAAAAAEAQAREQTEAREREEAAAREREEAEAREREEAERAAVARAAAEAEADAAARAAVRAFPRDMLLVNDTAQSWVVRKYVEPASTSVIHVRDEDDLHGLRQNCLNLLSVSDHYRPVAPAEGEDAAPNALRVVEIEDDQA